MTDQHTAATDRSEAQEDRVREPDEASTPPGHYIPDTPWIDQDRSPRPVPELDSDGHPWQVTDGGLHVGTHNGGSYCLEWLPHYPERRGGWGPAEGLEPAEARPREPEAEAG